MFCPRILESPGLDESALDEMAIRAALAGQLPAGWEVTTDEHDDARLQESQALDQSLGLIERMGEHGDAELPVIFCSKDTGATGKMDQALKRCGGKPLPALPLSRAHPVSSTAPRRAAP